ncbi:MAG: hypothetical protein IT372_37905, partial [Polyangiaceae bacterium]|nr:hypothetical protein [Polyangiaceae bacterium]
RGEEPFVELSLDDRAFAPGDEITGAVALGNVQGRKVRGIELSLVGYERVRLASEAHRFTAFLRADGRDEGRELPFRFRIPAAAPPAFDAGWAALFWSFEARVDLARANDIVHRTPIALAAFDRPPELGGMRRQIGAGRWRAVWEAVGAQHGLSLDRHELRLTGALSGCAAAVWVDAGAAQPSSALVGELRWPSWGIGLQIGLKRFMLPLSAGDEEGFGNRYRVRGRDPAQVRAVVAAPLRRALLAFDEVRLDDERVTVTSRTPGHDQPWLGEFLGRLARLGAEIAAASARIPPPASMASARPAWEAFARELHGRLELGPMSIRDGRQDGATFHVETRYERAAEPDRTEITLALDPPLDAAPELDDPEALAAASPAVRELVRELRGPGGAARLTGDGPPERPRALRVTAGAVVLALPAPLEDPSITREVMGTMLLLSQRLRGARGAGPYR